MPPSDTPCLSLAIDRLKTIEPQHYAIWVLQAPYAGGYVHHDCMWTESLTQAWHLWQSFFAPHRLSEMPSISPSLPLEETEADGQPKNYTGRVMQHLGVNLWQWLFDGPILTSFNQSQGIAIGQSRPLRLRLEIRDPELIDLPWEIMQSKYAKQAVSLNKQQILFSRTTSDVDRLPHLRSEQALNILLVLGEDSETDSSRSLVGSGSLNLEGEAAALARLLEQAAEGDPRYTGMLAPCHVTTLVQPTPAELIASLERGNYNVLIYEGHGVPAADGGLLYLCPDARINGTELAQVLVRCQVKLAVFNACWGAQSDHQGSQAIPRSSLAEVLIHHGVPAVLGMRDRIANHEAVSFIQALAQALAQRSPIDEAVAIARQQLLTLYRFNQPAWTLPVLYMHPEFNGELLRPLAEGVTEIPDPSVSWLGRNPPAYLRSLTTPPRVWPVRGGVLRVGRGERNDVVLQRPEVSRDHAEIFYRDTSPNGGSESTYLLRDVSRYGTWVLGREGWFRVHRQEVPIVSQTQLKFGDLRSQALEFVVEGANAQHQN
ncbi:CHAT domain-containing protein [Thermocoleostomius sinensis]|uniref:CHAT domain-containing protein n=1 Tax=Thermocoleostomius sinensis A174 TaxID=2016057 RepID=A0A9E8ZFE0_9CYAN|nr:CHAT domain-containing protein [Thermocoleostomius sinensis]WAL60824.1 CHAT domain-containing protein [Thermocoleostomius sinensis A174]